MCVKFRKEVLKQLLCKRTRLYA